VCAQLLHLISKLLYLCTRRLCLIAPAHSGYQRRLSDSKLLGRLSSGQLATCDTVQCRDEHRVFISFRLCDQQQAHISFCNVCCNGYNGLLFLSYCSFCFRISQCSYKNSTTLSSFSMTFQAWKMVLQNSMTFHDQ